MNGQKYRTTNGKGIVLYDNLTPFRENALMLDVSDSHSTTELKGNRKMVAPYRGLWWSATLIPTSVSRG